MAPEHWQTVQQVYHSALEVDPSRRAAFVDQACGTNETLKQEVVSLLAQADQGEQFLETPAIEVAARAVAGTTACPAAIGRYRVVRLLGEGGMGAVYEAEQDQPRRTVALKVIKPGFATAETLRRFQHESQALGRLQHPGIAQIYEASTSDTGFGPQPYFAMELIRGRSLKEYAAAQRLSACERMELMAKVCDAVEHAHQRGVIHRDLKPGNILVDETGQPKVLDFGVARVTDSDAQLTRQTDLGQLVGTLAYMSPEQVLGDPGAVDSRSDVYALGVMLYELLADRLPYDVHRKPLPEAIAVIQHEDPAPLSSVSRSYRGDVATIVAKALEKDKGRRYSSAAELASDIRRYLADEPIAARPASASYQLQKFARRHKALVAGAAAVLIVLAAGVIVSTWEAVRARSAERAAVEQRDRAAAAERRATAQEATGRQERDRALAAEARAQHERNAALSEKRRAGAETAKAQAINDFLQNDLLAQANVVNQLESGAKVDPDVKVRVLVDRAVARLAGKFERQPEVEAAIRYTIGRTYQGISSFAESEKQLRRALELQRRVLGADDPQTLKTMDALAGAVSFREAETLLGFTLRVRQRTLGPEHPETLRSMDSMAGNYWVAGQYAQAAALHRQCLEIRRRVLGPKHPDTLRSMHGVAIDYYEAGEYAQAAALLGQAGEQARRTFGPEHPETLNFKNTLGAVYRQQGKYKEAEVLDNEVLEIKRRVFGPEHTATLASMSNLAEDYLGNGKFAQAEALYRQTLDLRRRVGAPRDVVTLEIMTALAGTFAAEAKYSDAEALLNEALQIERRIPEHPLTLSRVIIYLTKRPCGSTMGNT